KLLVDPFQRVGGPQRFPLRGWESGEGEEFVTGLLEADADRLAAQFPLAQEANARLLDSLATRSIDHPPIILGEFFAQMRRRLGQQIPQLMISAALNRERGPLHFKRRGQSRIAINHSQARSAEIARGQRAHRAEPGLLALHPGQPQVEHHPAAVRARAQRDQHRYPHALFPDPHPRIPAVKKQVADPQFAEIPLRPRGEVFAQPPHQARHRILRQRRATQKRCEGAAQPARVGAAQVHPKDRLVDPLGAALVARDDLAAPLATAPIVVLDSRPRHRDRRRPKAGRQRSQALAVSVASSNRANALRWGCTQRALQFLIAEGLDGRPNPLPHQLLERPFSTHQTPAIALHGVILRHPPPSGRELGSTRRILTRSHFFHQLRDTTKVYVEGEVRINSLEGFWSLVKRGIGGVYHSVSTKHLQSYVSEYAWRYNHRNDQQSSFRTLLLRA